MVKVVESKVEPHGGYVVSHPTKKNAFHVVVDVKRPLLGDPPKDKQGRILKCPTCNQTHTHKTYHILLNDIGRAVVSPGVYKGLLAAQAFTEEGGLKLETHTPKPPNQTLGTRGGMMGLVPRREKTVIYHE